MTRAATWAAPASGALFVASAVGTRNAVVVTAAAGIAGVGAVALVVLVIPGCVVSRIGVMPVSPSGSTQWHRRRLGGDPAAVNPIRTHGDSTSVAPTLVSLLADTACRNARCRHSISSTSSM